MEFTLKDALNIQTGKIRRQKQALNKILTNAKKRIAHHAKNGKLFCVYSIPPFIVGIPPYDMSIAIEHVVTNLKSEGYIVRNVYNNDIFISWEEQNLRQQEKIKNKESKNKKKKKRDKTIMNKEYSHFAVPSKMRSSFTYNNNVIS